MLILQHIKCSNLYIRCNYILILKIYLSAITENEEKKVIKYISEGIFSKNECVDIISTLNRRFFPP